jgi:hypothetical protein
MNATCEERRGSRLEERLLVQHGGGQMCFVGGR